MDLVKEKAEGFILACRGTNSCACVGAPERYGAQIFRFGLGCHVDLEIFCGRLLPPPFYGAQGAL